MSTSSAQLDCVLLNVNAYLGQRRNGTTASNTTRNHEKIEVSLCPARPPLPSNLYVHGPELAPPPPPPRVIRVVEDLFHLRVAVDCSPDCISSSPEDSDYFVYRASTQRLPSLHWLERPHPFFHDDDVGLLSRGDSYTVAALLATCTPVYDLYILHSEKPLEWIYRKVSVTEPLRRLPVLIPEKCGRLLYHKASTVIAIGGEAGTMGWVDLWHGILICDVLREEPTLRGVLVPVPVPLDFVSCNGGQGTELGCPIPIRGIAFVNGGGDNPDCLKLVHLEANATLVPGNNFCDDETGSLNYQMHDWTIVTYTNTAMTSSCKDWRLDRRVQASDMTIDARIKYELLQSGLLGSAPGRALHNLLVSHPAPDISAAAHKGVVYLMARKKYEHSEVWLLTLDTRNNTLLGAAEFEERQPCAPAKAAMYCPSSIAKYIKLDIDVFVRRMLRFLDL